MMGVLLAVAVVGAGVALGTGNFALAAGIVVGWWVLAKLTLGSEQAYRPPTEPTRPIDPTIRDPQVRGAYGLPQLPERRTELSSAPKLSTDGPIDLNEVFRGKPLS